MIIICEGCGKKYRVDPSKIKEMTARFKCKSCDHILTVTKPIEKEELKEDITQTTQKEEPKKDSISIHRNYWAVIFVTNHEFQLIWNNFKL